MSTMVRVSILGMVLLLTACSSIRFNSQSVITAASFRSTVEPPVVAVRLLAEALPILAPVVPLSIEPPQPIIPDIVENILFESDSSLLSTTAMMQLDDFAMAVREGEYKILVEGHTDNSHSYEYNHALSESRALAVKDALIARGISRYRLVIDFHGETKATATNTHHVGKQQNRRVELRPLKPLQPQSETSHVPLNTRPIEVPETTQNPQQSTSTLRKSLSDKQQTYTLVPDKDIEIATELESKVY